METVNKINGIFFFFSQISTSALTILALIMLLAVRIRLEVMNVTASVILPESTVKQVGTMNTVLIGTFFVSYFPFLYFSSCPRGILYPAR